MNEIDAVILGIIQGLTEFLPGSFTIMEEKYYLLLLKNKQKILFQSLPKRLICRT